MSGDESWLYASREERQRVEHALVIRDRSQGGRYPRIDYRMSCSCGLKVKERLAGPVSAQVLHAMHVSLATGPAVCPSCGSGKPDHGHVQVIGSSSEDQRSVRVPCAITCAYVPWAEGECFRCTLSMGFLRREADWVSRRMIGAAL